MKRNVPHCEQPCTHTLFTHKQCTMKCLCTPCLDHQGCSLVSVKLAHKTPIPPTPKHTHTHTHLLPSHPQQCTLKCLCIPHLDHQRHSSVLISLTGETLEPSSPAPAHSHFVIHSSMKRLYIYIFLTLIIKDIPQFHSVKLASRATPPSPPPSLLFTHSSMG